MSPDGRNATTCWTASVTKDVTTREARFLNVAMPYWSVVEGYRGTPLSVKLAIEETSTVVTDVTDHVVRDTALPLGLVDNKVRD